MKLLIVEMWDGSKWGVPVDMIARNRAAHYAHEFGGDIERSLAEDTLPLFLEDAYQIEDWAVSNMNWSDFDGHQVKISDAPTPDFQDAWLSGDKGVIEIDAAPILSAPETFVADVRKFTEAVGCTTDQFNSRQTALYLGLMAEEFAEVLEALSLPHASSLHHLSGQFKAGRLDGAVMATNQRVELLDGCTDLAWVTIGCMLSQGADVLGAMREVARSNMSKLIEAHDGTPLAIKDINGKVVKSDNFIEPDLTPFICKE